MWTDSSRTLLIQEMKSRPIIWDKSVNLTDSTKAVSRTTALVEVANRLNEAFYPHVTPHMYTVEEIRSQWKNLKDTYIRKQRWLNEGKYMRDPHEEPAWKFFRSLKFLDGKDEEDKERRGAEAATASNGRSMKEEMFFDHSNESAPSTEEQMLSLFFKDSPSGSPPTVTETIVATSKAVSPVVHANTLPAPPHQTPPTLATPIHAPPTMRRDEEPRMKKPRLSMPAPVAADDEYALFGATVAHTLRRMTDEGSRIASLRLQKQINDLIFESQLSLLDKQS